MRLSALTLAPVVAAGAYVVLTDETPTSSGTVYAGVDSTTSGTDPATPDPTTSGTPGAPTPGTSPAAEPSRTPGDGGRAEPDPEAPSGVPSGDPASPPGDTATPDRPPTPSVPDTPPVSRPPSPDDPATSDPETPPSDPTEPSDPTTPPDPPDPPDETPDDPIEPPQPDPTVSLPPAPDLGSAERELVEATNAERARAGCPDLRVDGALTRAAGEHSADMRSRLYLSHVSPDGSTPADRAAAAGFDGVVGETIRYGTWDAERVVDRWMSRPDDRSKLLDCSYTSIGVGRESGLLGTWWTQVLGRE